MTFSSKAAWNGVFALETALFGTGLGLEDALEVLWEYFKELSGGGWPISEDFAGAGGAGEQNMLFQLCFDSIHLIVAALDELI